MNGSGRSYSNGCCDWLILIQWVESLDRRGQHEPLERLHVCKFCNSYFLFAFCVNWPPKVIPDTPHPESDRKSAPIKSIRRKSGQRKPILSKTNFGAWQGRNGWLRSAVIQIEENKIKDSMHVRHPLKIPQIQKEWGMATFL